MYIHPRASRVSRHTRRFHLSPGLSLLPGTSVHPIKLIASARGRILIAAVMLAMLGGLTVPFVLAQESGPQTTGSARTDKTTQVAAKTANGGTTTGTTGSRAAAPAASTPAATATAPKPTAAGTKPVASNATPPAAPATACANDVGGINLANWYLTLPTGTEGDPDTVQPPQLSGFRREPYMYTKDGGLAFRANAGGATTRNSNYPRSELREMSGATKAAWDTDSGRHCMRIRQAVTALPTVKPEVVTAQIHDSSDDVVMVRLEGKQLFVEANGSSIGMLDDNYTLGKVFTVTLEATGGRIKVSYDGVPKVDIARVAHGCYFKAGVYTQSNPSNGEAPDAYGEVVIYDLQVSHS